MPSVNQWHAEVILACSTSDFAVHEQLASFALFEWLMLLSPALCTRPVCRASTVLACIAQVLWQRGRMGWHVQASGGVR